MPPKRMQTKRDIQKTPIFAPYSRRKLFPQTLHADRERHDNYKRCESFFDPTRSFPAGAKMLLLATDALSKFNTGRLSSCHGNLPVRNKHHIFAPTAGARCATFPELCMVIELVVPIKKVSSIFLIQTHSFSYRAHGKKLA